MKIGIIGAGQVSLAFARYLLASGHEVLLSNSRGPQTLASQVENLGTGAIAVTAPQAAEAPIVLLAVPWLKIGEALKDLPAWDGRILIDATNPFIGPGQVADLAGRGSSEIVAEQVPGARVVKALNHMFMTNFAAGPVLSTGRRVTFVSGDNQEAKDLVGSLLNESGFAVVDLGSLRDGGRMQQVVGPLAGLDLTLQTKER